MQSMWMWLKENRVLILNALAGCFSTITLIFLLVTSYAKRQRDAEQDRQIQAVTATMRELVWQVIELKTDKLQDPLPKRPR